MVNLKLTPKISIIITNYNYERYVGKAINSVIEQTYNNCECIVVDDGSTDDSLDVIRRFNGINAIQKQNGGQLSAVIEGIKYASGDVIIFLDADDYLYPTACQRVADSFDESISLIQYELDKIDIHGNKIGKYPDFDFMNMDYRDAILKFGYFHTSPTSGNAFSRAHVRKMIGTLQMDSEQNKFFDGYFLFAAPFTGNVVVMRERLGAYLIHGNNASLSSGRSIRTITNSIRNAAWQKKGYLRMLYPNKVEHELEFIAECTLAPFYYRNALIVRRAHPSEEQILGQFSNANLAVRALKGFAVYPRMQLMRKLTNAILLFAVYFGPRALARRFVRSERA